MIKHHRKTLIRWIKNHLRTCLMTLSLFLSPQAFAVDAINTTFFGNLAIQGYDPVAYFTQNKAIEGSEHYKVQWKDANWRFSNAENLALFKDSPEKYAPQYGGYCAYAISQNSVAGIKPELFTIHDGKLYLNYNHSINQKWRENRDQYIIDANQHWPQLLAQ